MRTLLLTAFLTGLALVASASERIAFTTPAWHFSADEGWDVWWADAAKPKPFTLEQVPGGLRVTLAAGGDDLGVSLWSERFKIRELLGAPEAVQLEVELVAGAARIGLDLFDAQQEGLHYAERTLSAGVQTLTWELTEKPQHSWGERRNLLPDMPVGLWGLAISRPAASAPTVLVLRAGLRRERAFPSSLISLSLDTGSPLHLLPPGATPVVVLANRASAPVTVDLVVTSEDWAGDKIPSAATLTVPANGSLRWPLPSKPTARGIHWLECSLADHGDATPRSWERLPFAVLDAPVKRPQRDGFLFGVVGGLPGPGGDAPAYLDHAVETVRWLGLRNLRTGVNWEYVEAAPGQWNEAWLDWFSRSVDRFDAIGTKIQFLLCYTTRYAAAAGKREAKDHLEWMFSPPDLEAWRRYVAKMVARYGDRVRLWEAWNEADIEFWRGSVEQYEQLLHVTHEEVKRGDAQRQLMTSGFAFCWKRDGNPIAEVPYRVSKESRADYDILAYHLHYRPDEYRRILEGPLAKLRKEAGDPPLLFNECALNLDVFGERGQAEALPKKLLIAWSQGAIGYYWYNLTGGLRRAVPGGDANWGLMTDDFHPRAVFCAYHALMGLLADATCRGRLSNVGDRLAIRFDTPAGQVVAAWDEDASASSEALVLAVGAGARCTAIDLMGERHALSSDGGICLMPVGHTPSYVLIEGASAPVSARASVVHIAPGVVAIPGRQTPMVLTLANPLERAATLKLSWRTPAGLGAIPEQRVELVAGATRALTVELSAPAGMAVRLGEQVACQLDLAIEQTGHHVAVSIPVMKAPRLPAGEFTRAPDLTLQERSAVINLHENVPQRQQRNWTGPADLSLQAWLGRQGDRLALRVVVRDDQHVQNHSAKDAWQGDSLQVAFARPGAAGWWEFTLARDAASGAPLIHTGIRANDAADPTADVRLVTTRVGDLTTYDASWPLAIFGLTSERLAAGIAFDLVANDDDGEGRDGWIELAPGVGMTKDPHEFPLVSLE